MTAQDVHTIKVPKAIAGEEVLPKLRKKRAAAAKEPRQRRQPRPRTIALDRAYVAPENARAGLPPEDVPALAANIEVFGLLQPLSGYEDDAGAFAVTAGRRRLAALTLLRDQGFASQDLDWNAIPASEIDQADAIGASLAENTQRVDLSIVESAVQFERMSTAGEPVATIAKAFGVTERFVKGRLKLAGLHEPILEALRAGDISLDVAQIYAGATMSRQEKVWSKLGKSGQRNAHRIKEELKRDTLLAGDSLARFVGEEAYVAAGGEIEAELFTSADMSRWLDPDLARDLAKKKLAAAKTQLEAEGFLFVEAAPEIAYGKYVDGNLGKARKANTDEAARLKAIAAREKELAAEEKAIHAAADKRTGEKYGGGDYTDAEDARLDAIQEEESNLRTETQRIKAGQVEFDDKAKTKSGVTVTIDEDGALLVTRGVVAPKEAKGARIAGSMHDTKAKRAAKVDKANAREGKAEAMTNPTHERCSRVASAIVGRSLMQKPAIAVAVIAAFLARQVLKGTKRSPYGYSAPSEVLNLSITDHRFERTDRPALTSDKERDVERKHWADSIEHWDLAETIIAAWPMDTQLKLLAFCVGEQIRMIEAAPHSIDKKERAQLAAIATLTGADPAAHFQPDTDFLKGLSSDSLQSAAREMGVATAGCKTKGALAALIADHAKQKKWTPPLVRTLCGIEVRVAPKPRSGEGGKPTKKASKSLPAPPEAKAKPVRSDAGKGAAAKTANSAAKAAAPKPPKKATKVAKKPKTAAAKRKAA